MSRRALDRPFFWGFFFGLLTGVVASLHAAGIILSTPVPSSLQNFVNYLTWIFGWIGVMVSVLDASSGSRLISAKFDGFVVGFGTFLATYGLLIRIPFFTL